MTTAQQTCLWLTLKKKQKLYYMLHLQITYGRILVYIFCLISIGLSLSDDANKMKFLNIESAQQMNFSYLWKLEPDIPNSFG